MNFRKSILYAFLLAVCVLCLGACSKKSVITVRITVSDAGKNRVWGDTSGKVTLSKADFFANYHSSELLNKTKRRVWANLGVWGLSAMRRVGGYDKDGWDRGELERELKLVFYNPNILRDSLQEEKYTPNDAKISGVRVTYFDENGKKVEDLQGGKQVGEIFSKDYVVPAGRVFFVTSTATEGESLLPEQASQIAVDAENGATNWMKYVYGRKTGGAEVRLTVEILKDGVLIHSKQVISPKEAKAETGLVLGAPIQTVRG